MNKHAGGYGVGKVWSTFFHGEAGFLVLCAGEVQVSEVCLVHCLVFFVYCLCSLVRL